MALRIISAAVLAIVLLSHLTNYDYLWGGIGETWLRGWENAQIDDLAFREHVRTIPASSNPPNLGQKGPIGGAWPLSEEGRSWLRTAKRRVFWSFNTTAWSTSRISKATTPRH